MRRGAVLGGEGVGSERAAARFVAEYLADDFLRLVPTILGDEDARHRLACVHR